MNVRGDGDCDGHSALLTWVSPSICSGGNNVVSVAVNSLNMSPCHLPSHPPSFVNVPPHELLLKLSQNFADPRKYAVDCLARVLSRDHLCYNRCR